MAPSPIFHFTEGNSPLLVSIPHSGESIPESLGGRLTASAAKLPDTDWFLDRLYDWTPKLGASLIVANYSRYVVDLNRPPNDKRLYTTTTTGLFPTEQFDGDPIYRLRAEPTNEQRNETLVTFYQPYHQKIVNEINRLRELHGFAIVFDAHSIRSRLPRLFEGVLPELNLGTNQSLSCGPEIEKAAAELLCGHPEYCCVVNGRFQGGYITRHYGDPANNVHALQLEISQRVYMNDLELEYAEERAKRLQPVLRSLMEAILGNSTS